MNEAEFKRRFKDCMSQLWPAGLIGADRRMLRDLIRVFSMGVIETYLFEDLHGPLRRTTQWMESTAHECWMPDESWNWWEDVRRN